MRRGRLNQESPTGAGSAGDTRSVAKGPSLLPLNYFTEDNQSVAPTNSPKISQSIHFSHSAFNQRYQETQDFAFDLDLNPDL